MKKIFCLIVMLAVTGLFVVGCQNNSNPVDSQNSALSLDKGKQGQSGKSVVFHADLVPFTNGDTQAWGNVTWNTDKKTYVINAKKLEADSWYAFYTGGGLVSFAMTNHGGNLHLEGTYESLGNHFNIWTCDENGVKGARILWTE